MAIAIIIHDPLDNYIPLNGEMWSNLRAAFNIHHVFKKGGKQAKGFVHFGPEHEIPHKKVCVMTPAEASSVGITTVDLVDYSPPLECTYVFGPDNDIRGWHEAFSDPDTDYVSISTPRNTELYSLFAANMVLWHHMRQ